MDTKELEAALSRQIKVELADRGMTQETLAEAMGTGRPALSRYLMGHRSMTTQTFFKLSEALGLAPSVLLGRAQERLTATPPTVPSRYSRPQQ